MKPSVFALVLVCAAVAAAMGPADPWGGKLRLLHRAHPTEERTTVTLVLKGQNMDRLMDTVMEVSHPESAQYGQYLSRDEVTARFGASDAALAAVEAWCESIGLDLDAVDVSEGRRYVELDMACGHVEEAFDTRMHHYAHADRPGMKLIRSHEVGSRAAEAFVPAELEAHVEFVHGLVDVIVLPRRRPKFSLETALELEAEAMARRVRDGLPAEEPTDEGQAPKIIMAFGGHDEVFLAFKPYCASGAVVNTTTEIMCATDGHGPPIKGLGVRLVQDEKYTEVFMPLNTVDLVESQCLYNPDASAVGCFFVVPVGESLQQYRPITLEMEVFFEDDTVSEGTMKEHITCGAFVTPSKLREVYKVPQQLEGSHPDNYQSVMAFQDQYISRDDLKMFNQRMGQPQHDPVFRGTNHESEPGGESTLDIQYVTGTGPGVKTLFWHIDNNGFLLEWMRDAERIDVLPYVISVSYGLPMEVLNMSAGVGYGKTVNEDLGKLAAQGITILVASGDDGVADVADASYCGLPFKVDFPASSPYVTAVGASILTTRVNDFCERDTVYNLGATIDSNPVRLAARCSDMGERTCNSEAGSGIDTGGGYSNWFGMPEWQKATTLAYVQSDMVADLPNGFVVPPYFAQDTTYGRAVPDVALLGHNYVVYQDGAPSPVDGTSASTPAFAGLVSLINDARLHAGKPVMGLLGPWLYKVAASHPEAFNDILMGSNPATRDPSVVCPHSYTAWKGWDPLGGLGTPNFNALFNLALGYEQYNAFAPPVGPAGSKGPAGPRGAQGPRGEPGTGHGTKDAAKKDDLEHVTAGLSTMIVITVLWLTALTVLVYRSRRGGNASAAVALTGNEYRAA